MVYSPRICRARVGFSKSQGGKVSPVKTAGVKWRSKSERERSRCGVACCGMGVWVQEVRRTITRRRQRLIGWDCGGAVGGSQLRDGLRNGRLVADGWKR